ncbi:hypothetical protein KAR91_49140 [Candidatus Pacearchaeota archaeon]|nr:hypothetical protein [Candidatus Pacearchaeota archaeon]
MVPNFDFQEVAQMRQRGDSWRKVGEHYDCAHTTVMKWFSKQQNMLVEFKQPSRAYRQPVRTTMQGNGERPDDEPYISNLNHDQWCKKYAPQFNEWKNLPYLTNMSKSLWQDKRKLNFYQRGAGKSFRAISIFARWILEKREPLLVLVDGPSNKFTMFYSIKEIITSDLVVQDYGEPYTSINANKSIILIKPHLKPSPTRDPVLRIASRGENIIGSHPRWIHMEDLIQAQFKSTETQEGLFRWFDQVVKLCATHERGKETRITGTGTRKDRKDFYEHLIRKHRFPVSIVPALKLKSGRWPTNKDITYTKDSAKINVNVGKFKTIKCPNWPLAALLLKKIEDPVAFRTEMQNDPVDPMGNYFEKDEWSEVSWDYTDESQFVISLDPAFGQSKGADNTAIIVLARAAPRQYVVVHVFAQQTKHINDALDVIYEKFNKYSGVLRTICEANFAQKVLVVDRLNDVLNFPVAPFLNKGNKILRIQGTLKDAFASRRITVWRDAVGKSLLYDEYLSFMPQPSTAGRHDDCLDALQMGFETWSKLDGQITRRKAFTMGAYSDSKRTTQRQRRDRR